MTDQASIRDVVVVGAGPAGLIAALALTDVGAHVTLVAPPLPPEDFRTTALLSGSVEFLDRIGVWDLAAGAAAPLKTMRLIDGTRRLVRAPEIAFHADEIGLEAFGYNIGNRDLTRALEQRVAESSIVRIESMAASMSVDDLGVTIVATDGTAIRARLAVAADGRNSLVRQAAGIAAKTWDYAQTALVLNLDHTASHNDTSTEFHTETGPFTLVPLLPRRSSLVCVEKPAVAEALMQMDDAVLALELERRASSLLGKFTVASPRQTWKMGGLSAKALSAKRVALVAEAAHAFPPIGAQGMNLGIRDIICLSELVRKAVARGEDVGASALTDRYARDRRADVTSRTTGVDLLNRSLLTGFLPVQIARGLMLTLARDVNPIRKFLMREGLRPHLFQSV